MFCALTCSLFANCRSKLQKFEVRWRPSGKVSFSMGLFPRVEYGQSPLREMQTGDFNKRRHDVWPHSTSARARQLAKSIRTIGTAEKDENRRNNRSAPSDSGYIRCGLQILVRRWSMFCFRIQLRLKMTKSYADTPSTSYDTDELPQYEQVH